MPSLKRAQCFLSSPKWAKTTVLRSFPAESSGASIQWRKVWGLPVKREEGSEETLGSWVVDQPTDCLVYNRRVQVLPSRSEEETNLCKEQLGSKPDNLLASYFVGVTLKTLISSSASLLAYILQHLQNVSFLYSKGLSPPYRLGVLTYYTFLSLYFIRRKK